jgi:beta-mannosidase
LHPPVLHPLHEGWTVSPADVAPGDDSSSITATVPGCVHVDLLAAGRIPDPFLDANELDVAWVADGDWRYRTTINGSNHHDRVDLVFTGLDTFAEVAIDGIDVGRAANMHRSYRFDTGALLAAPGEHELTVTFRSATRAADATRQREGDWPSSSFDRPFNYVRKMACAWGWDWGPWLTTAGIWRPATLHAWDAARLDSVRPVSRLLAGSEGDHGAVTVTGTVERTRDVVLTAEAWLVDPHGAEVATATATIAPGDRDVRLDLDAGPVERWWPVGHGAQPLYSLTLRLVSGERGARVVLDEWRRRVGFRTVRLDTSADATGSAFTFVVNERPLFVRGVNWIPDDPFPSRVTSERYHHRLRQAVDANVSMLRVWGGGIYEDDAFYDACDELGLLVWQDFLFACAAYPEDLLADEVEAEARDNVERLMTHPSLALWNGNNENIWGYFDWDWQPALQGKPWGAGFYFDVLPRVVADIDPGRPYWPGSPYSGSMAVAPNADAHGCIHEWSVWNQLDYSRYRDRTPRFVAEFGWQAPPTWATLRASISDNPLTPSSPGMLHHQKALDGNGKLERGLAHHVEVPSDFDTWLWAMQLNQARALRTGVEHFRSLRGTCMGTIWWQLNDCWPVTSWAVVDGGGRRKPAWYALGEAYAPRLLTIQPRGGELVLFAVNDSAESWPLDGAVIRWTFDGAAIAEAEVSLSVAPWSIAARSVPESVARPDDRTGEVLRAVAGGSSAWWWFAADRELRYPAATLSVERIESVTPGRLQVDVAAQTLVRDLAVMVDRVDPSLTIDRQLTSLLPGDRVSLEIASADGTAVSPERFGAGALQRPVWWTANDLVRPR